MKVRTLLSNTLCTYSAFGRGGNDVSRLGVNSKFYSAASAYLDKHQPSTLNGFFLDLSAMASSERLLRVRIFLFIAVVLYVVKLRLFRVCENKLRLFAYLFFSSTML